MGSLFPIDLPGQEWVRFRAAGFDELACGVIYRLHHPVADGMPLGGIDTGCIDLETSGLWGYCTLFNTHVPRRGPLNLPLIGASVDDHTWVLCHPRPKEGLGEYQHIRPRGSYRLWQGQGYENAEVPFRPGPDRLELEGVETAHQIHYWGHYPVVDLEFETSAPVRFGLRVWAPFLPGDLIASMIPGILFELHLRNPDSRAHWVSTALSFPGPLPEEAGTERFERQSMQGEGFIGMEVRGPLAAYVLGALDQEKVRLGGSLKGDGAAWSRLQEVLPVATEVEAGISAAVDLVLEPGQQQLVHWIMAWYAPTWNAGGHNWANARHTFVHMYAKHYPRPLDTALLLAREHCNLLRRILAWQQVIYAETSLPLWLRDSLVNNLHLITEDGLWAQALPPLPDWVRPEDGLFGLIECPRGCPQIECLPPSALGTQPLVYFFPELALSTLHGYRGYQYSDGTPTWVFGGCTAGTPPLDFASPTPGYQHTSNGICLAMMVDRYWLCYPSADFVQEFYPMLKECARWTVGLRTTPSYTLGERIIAMPDPDHRESFGSPKEWFEADDPGFFGLSAHVGGLHLAQLRITERLAREAGDEAFGHQCAAWIEAGTQAMEQRLWNGAYYLMSFDPETGQRSELIFSQQLDGEWILAHHGLERALPRERILKTLETIARCNVPATRYGAAVLYANPDGTLREAARPDHWDYGPYASFSHSDLMLAMNYLYEGQREFGLGLAHKVWHNLVCRQGYTWQMPNGTRGDADTGEGRFGNQYSDYYMNMMLWSLPAAIVGQDFSGPTQPGGLVHRILQAARQTREGKE